MTGDCYLREWSEWSLCQLTCVNGEDLGFGGIQVRSRAVIIQELENQHLCPEQALETRPCNGKHQNTHKTITLPVRKKKKIQSYSKFVFFLLRLSKLGKYGELWEQRNALNFFVFQTEKLMLTITCFHFNHCYFWSFFNNEISLYGLGKKNNNCLIFLITS